MSFLIIGDIHFKINNSLQTDILHKEVIEIINKRNPDFIILLGDLNDRHEKIDLAPFNRIEKFLRDINKTGKEVFSLIGNHDLSGPKEYLSDIHVFNAFKMWPKMNIIDKCQLFEREINGEIIKFICSPYVPNNMFLQALKDCNLTDEIIKTANIVFCHSEFTGSKINKLSKSICDTYPSDFPLNIAGHLHDEEIVSNNLFYIGTPFQQSFSENPNKGVNIITIKSGKINIEKIKLSIPQKIMITINYKELYTINLPKECELKVKIIGPIKQVKELMKTQELSLKFSKAKIIYSDTSIIKEIPTNKNSLTFSEKIINEFNDNTELSLLFKNIFFNI